MQLLQKLLLKLNGLGYNQDYLCLAEEHFQKPLQVYLVRDDRIVLDITRQHAFTGYSPLIFAFTKLPGDSTIIDLVFSDKQLSPQVQISGKQVLAGLKLKRFHQQTQGEETISYYEGQSASHRFTGGFHQFISALYNRLYNKKPGNVFLEGNLLTQVQVAYSLPRRIALVTVGSNGLYNCFPSDLHGAAGSQYYIVSLRHKGRACKQVVAAGKLLLSFLSADQYRMAYKLGKNHMQDLSPSAQFPFSNAVSPNFQLPVPEKTVGYRELELVDSFDHGIHKLMLFRIVSSRQISNAPATLAHIHQSYASWRRKQGLPGNYYLR